MQLFHGSRQHGLNVLLPIEETGVAGPTDGGREHCRDVVFLTTSIEQARIYAGKEGVVYEVVAAEELQSYKGCYQEKMKGKKAASLLRKKAAKLPSHIWIARKAVVRALPHLVSTRH